jgi:hypothetical protein
MKQKIQYLLIAALAIFVCMQKSYSQKNLVMRQVDKNTVARKVPGKENVIPFLQQRSKNGVVNVYEFNTDALRDDVFFLNIFPGQSIKVVKQKVDKRSENDFTWYGVINGSKGQEGSIAMVYLNGELSGNLNYKAGNYSINPMGKSSFSLYEINSKRFPKHEDAPGMTDSRDKAPNAGAAPNAAVAAALCNLRVLVAYTPSAENYIKNYLGFSSLTQFAQQAVAETNQGYINSGVNIHLELAASVRVNYPESGNYSTDLNRFQQTTDGYMDEIHTYRNLYAADVNVLIFNNSQYCGMATTILANASNAFGVVHYDCALGYYSFAHEIAHLQGCDHNPEQNRNPRYSYGHGYVYSAGGWRTIMAYNYNGETRIQYFSNPNVTYGGVAMGTAATHNNARVLNETTGTINNFRNASSTLTINSAGAVINDESSDAIATSEVILQPGFEATGNSEFRARIINCVGASIAADEEQEVITRKDQLNDAKAGLTIYPTITGGPVHISTDNSILKDAEILVTDNSGRIVARSINNAGKKMVTVNLAPFPNGIYFIQVKQGDKMITRKVIVSH